ncbi:hypothetical protein V2J09_006238 [Rumex salicifolius]
MAAANSSPSLEILVREPTVSSIWIGPPFVSGQPENKLEKISCSSATFSEDGSKLMVIKPESVVSIYDCTTYEELRSFKVPNLVAASLSPRGTYVQTFQKSTAPQEKNVKIWVIETGASVLNHFQKNVTKATCGDESGCLRSMGSWGMINRSDWIGFWLENFKDDWLDLEFWKRGGKGKGEMKMINKRKKIDSLGLLLQPTTIERMKMSPARKIMNRSFITFLVKRPVKTEEPSISFSSDEVLASHLATNEIQFFDPKDFSKGIVSRHRVPKVAAIKLSKHPGTHVAAFVPESKGVPASVQIFGCGGNDHSEPLARRSFFRCSQVQLHWNFGSTGLLVVAQSDVDATNQSYYGESKLHYLTTDGTHAGLVPLSREGPVHDVQWSCTGAEFAVVYGFMPAKATIFDKKSNPLFELGSGPYNTIRMNPKGRFLCLAGFGNLPGDMAFWDYVEKKQIGTTKAEWSVTSEWSPNGCYFMTATTAPRLQVDNGIKIFHPNGSLYYKKMFDKLYQADWKPDCAENFGDITELMKSLGLIQVADAKSAAPGQGPKPKQLSAKTPPPNLQKPAAYRPPSAKSAASVKAELFRGLSDQEMSKNALKNKKKREKLKEKKAAEGSSASRGA